jgi:hypothetical protein
VISTHRGPQLLVLVPVLLVLVLVLLVYGRTPTLDACSSLLNTAEQPSKLRR